MVKILSLILLGLSVVGLAAGQGTVQPDALKQLENKGLPALQARLAKSKTCTKENLRIRKEWGDVPKDERRRYIAAVQCLLNTPSRLDPKRYPGAKSRYDDFVAVHINQSLTIHGTGNFLSWHRYYTFAYETALRNECHYNGTQPYWDYGRWAQDPEKSPIFDGSDTSLSGNGKKIAHKGNAIAPAGNGGGCVETGPFKNMTVYLGPLSAAVDPPPARNPRADGFGANPRCLRRDMSNYLTSRWGRTQDMVQLITNSKDVGSFQSTMENGGGWGTQGIHSVGHFTINGDPGGDFYVSPNDPAFFVHHAMIDRLWTIWQSQSLETRLEVIHGGTSMFGGGRAQSLDDLIDMNVVEPTQKTWKIRELVSVVDGPLCYMYE
ncbi:hypothetical protein MAPG_10411 [Magnaporthiopsis poae ATCC 64411]|uniref:Tyrosinase copper-binding domain-containing protein n=1 Tax=Magnaporthiopsis poae (strain ATCC 64411 / 73-15) TaxID=644358 RepID=A0A0C4ECI4_MAGP6|nr:hypothetical protein MAPG_10411 [Magnaporthiopsis poae ATCC 64411]